MLPDPEGDGVWTTAHGGNEIALVSAATGKIAVQYRATPAEGQPRPSLPYGLARDSRGHLWVAEHEGNKVARVIPGEETLNEYPVEEQFAWIQWLAVDGQGDVWFAKYGGNAIGRIAAAEAPVFSVQLNETTLEVPNSGSREGTMRVGAVGDAAGELEMKGFLVPSGVEVAFEPAKVRVEPGKPATVRYTVRATPSASVHTYPFQIGARGEGVIASRTLALAVLPKGASPGSGRGGEAEGRVPAPAAAGSEAGAGGSGGGAKTVGLAAALAGLALAGWLLALRRRAAARRRGGPGRADG